MVTQISYHLTDTSDTIEGVVIVNGQFHSAIRGQEEFDAVIKRWVLDRYAKATITIETPEPKKI